MRSTDSNEMSDLPSVLVRAPEAYILAQPHTRTRGTFCIRPSILHPPRPSESDRAGQRTILLGPMRHAYAA